jgi:hypothetical protein
MVYDIEFIRHIDGKAEALALHAVRLVGERVAAVISQAEELYQKFETLPRPNGYRIRGEDGEVVHEFLEPFVA